jgi:hypothetical protein
MTYVRKYTGLQRVRKRSVANVVQQNGNGGGFNFVVGYVVAPAPEGTQGNPHQVHGTNSVVKTGV